MAKIVYNACYGGFGLNEKAMLRYAELKGPEASGVEYYDIPRDDPALVQVVEELGEEANDLHANLKIEELPGGMQWLIDSYDGYEQVVTPGDYTWNVAKD